MYSLQFGKVHRALASGCSAVNPNLSPLIPSNIALCFSSRKYADISSKKLANVSASGSKTKEFPVEADTHRLQEFCCGSNIYSDGEDVRLKPENEYPDWLWTLHTGPPRTLDQLDPNTKEYWERVRLEHYWRQKALHKFRTKILKRF